MFVSSCVFSSVAAAPYVFLHTEAYMMSWRCTAAALGQLCMAAVMTHLSIDLSACSLRVDNPRNLQFLCASMTMYTRRVLDRR